MMNKNCISTKLVIYTAMLVATEIVLNRFLSINVWNMKIGFSFIPIVLAAIMFNPMVAGIVAAMGDFLGAVLFPIGPYFPGFTAVAFILGVGFGIILRGEYSFSKVVLASALAQLLCTLLLNTWCISYLYGAPYLALLATRSFQAIVMFVVQLASIPMVYKIARTAKKQVGLA